MQTGAEKAINRFDPFDILEVPPGSSNNDIKKDLVDLPRSTALSVPTSRRPTSMKANSHHRSSLLKLDNASETVSSSSLTKVIFSCPRPIVYLPGLTWNASALEAFRARFGA